MEVLFLWAIGTGLFGFLGHVLGRGRGNESAGMILGMLLGPLGCLIAALLPDTRTKPRGECVARPDRMEEWEARERAKVPLAVPSHLRGRTVDDEA